MYIRQLNRDNHKKCLLVTSMNKILEKHLQRSPVFLETVVDKSPVCEKSPSSQLFFTKRILQKGVLSEGATRAVL